MNKFKKYHSRRYHLDESFFDTWSPMMAYVLGFWFADGYMRVEKSYRVLFTSNDRQILKAIRKTLKSNHPIRKAKRDQSYNISFHSKHLYKKLKDLGGLRRKSRKMAFPHVPNKYIRDFVRGYFDGDGSVFFVEYIRTKDKRMTKELRTNFTSGSRIFLESLMRILNKELNLPMKKLGAFNAGASLRLGYGMKDSDALLHYLYYDNFPIGLKRKAVFVSRIPLYQKHFFHTAARMIK